MASIPIHNETDYPLTDDMTQYIIRDTQEHFGEEVRGIRVQAGIERHAFNARTREVRYAFSPQTLALVRRCPLRQSHTPQRHLDHGDDQRSEMRRQKKRASQHHGRTMRRTWSPWKRRWTVSMKGKRTRRTTTLFTLDDPVEDTDEDEEDNRLDEEERRIHRRQARGKAQAVARTRAAVTYDKTVSCGHRPHTSACQGPSPRRGERWSNLCTR